MVPFSESPFISTPRRPKMVGRRGRGRGNSKESDGEEMGAGENGIAGVPGYEQIRDQRIKENKERMQKLGILDLSQQLKSRAAPPKRSRLVKDTSDQTKTQNPMPNPGSPPRRSSR